MDNIMLQQLAKRLQLTNFEPEPDPYILTPEEEESLLENAIKQKRDWYYWKMAAQNLPEGDIEAKIAQMDFRSMVDTKTLFSAANASKNHELWQKENRRKEKEEEERKSQELKKAWSATRMYQLMAWTSEKSFGKELIVDGSNKHLITTLCFYLSGDKRFEEDLKYSFSKGLLIRGSAGLGKTHLVKCLENNGLNPINILSMLEITHEVSMYGEYDIKMNGRKVLYLDDVGTEESVVKHYGTNISFFKEFIERQYLHTQSGKNIIISTNNSAAEFEERYGFRVRSRLREMFNIVDISGPDRRE